MSLLAQILLVAALIAAMMLFRLLAERTVTKSRLRTGLTDAKCGKTECFRACDHDDAADADRIVTENNVTKRSARRAP